MSLLPIVLENGCIEDGDFINAHSYCIRMCNKGECFAFYNKIRQEGKTGFSQCPNGMTIYYNRESGNLFTCFKCKSHYNSQKEKKLLNTSIIPINPLLNDLEAQHLVQSCEKNLETEKKEKELSEKFDTLFHEIKGLNGRNVTQCDDTLQIFFKEDEKNLNSDEYLKLKERIRTLYFSSNLIRMRLELDNLDEKIEQGYDDDRDTSIYGKFLKISKFYQSKLQKIPLEGESYRTISANSIFEYIPLLLIDNAVKYSYNYNPITIYFTDEDRLVVTVESYGPHCSKEELEHIMEKNYRGKEAKLLQPGSGLGLYYVKKLCDYYDINLSFDTGTVQNVCEKKLSKFYVRLEFN